MGHSTKAEAALALHRFGMGPRPGSIAAIQSDPRGALMVGARELLDTGTSGYLRTRLQPDDRAALRRR